MPISYSDAAAMWNAYASNMNLWRHSPQADVGEVMEYQRAARQHERFESDLMTSRCPYCQTPRSHNTFCDNEFCRDFLQGQIELNAWRPRNTMIVRDDF